MDDETLMMMADEPSSGSGDRGNQATGEQQQPKAQSGEAVTESEEAPPEPDPDSCRAIAICLQHLEEGAVAGEWDDTDFDYYLEPAGVVQSKLLCERVHDEGPPRAGLLMTRAAWQRHGAFLSDELNPGRYELSFPKEVGYVKPLAHYQPSSREHAKYPWTKKY